MNFLLALGLPFYLPLAIFYLIAVIQKKESSISCKTKTFQNWKKTCFAYLCFYIFLEFTYSSVLYFADRLILKGLLAPSAIFLIQRASFSFLIFLKSLIFLPSFWNHQIKTKIRYLFITIFFLGNILTLVTSGIEKTSHYFQIPYSAIFSLPTISIEAFLTFILSLHFLVYIFPALFIFPILVFWATYPKDNLKN